MRNLLAVLVVLAVALAVMGFWRGWFSFDTATGGDTARANLIVDKEKFNKDKEQLKAEAAAQSRALAAKLADLREKAKGLSGEDRVKADKQIEELSQKRVSLDAKLKELEEAGADKFEELKKGIVGLYEQHTGDTGK